MSSLSRSLLLTTALLSTGCSPHTVDPGTVGVLIVWGELQEESHGEGFYWESWFGEKYYNYDARIQKKEAKSSASSKESPQLSTRPLTRKAVTRGVSLARIGS